MANKVVDISKYINADAPQIVLFGKTYTVKNDKKTILLMNELQRRTASDDTETDEKIIKLLIGETHAEEILNIINESPNYAENERAILLNIMALATGRDYEELEARFQKQQQQQ